MMQKSQNKFGAFWLRMKIVPFLVILVILFGAAVTLATRVPAMAAEVNTYSWQSAPCAWNGNITGKCSRYDWGEKTCPSGDSYCNSKNQINGYYLYDNWGYGFRNCTSYVAEKISQVFSKSISGWGDAYNWAYAATHSPNHYTLDSTPQVGDIAQWNYTKANPYGHVAYVYQVSNGVATFDEYNVAGTGLFTSTYTSTNYPAGAPNNYIHIGTPPGGGSGWNGVGNATFLGSDHLTVGQTMNSNQYITSGNVQFALIMQTDGNLCEYNNGKSLWCSGTSGNSGAYLGVQGDGNIVIYSSSGHALWATGTNGDSLSSFYMQTDGNIVAYTTSGQAVWASNTGSWPMYTYYGSDHLNNGQTLTSGNYIRSADSRYALLMQTDGNLIMYGPGYHVLWGSGTGGNPGAYLGLQSDGNMVVYSSSGHALWASNTGGQSLSYLVMQTDGNLVAYNTSNAAIWATGTNGQI